MSLIKRSIVMAATFLLAFYASAPGRAAESSADIAAKFYAAAKSEGKLVIYGLGEPFLTPIRDAFKKRYPGIEIEAFDEPGRASRERVVAEQRTGRIIGDVIIAGPANHAQLEDLGFLQLYQTSQMPYLIPELLPDSKYTNPLRASIFSVAVNTKLLPAAEEPRAWTDLLLPKFKDSSQAWRRRSASII
jgi:iron(III) transport system substrate-binding protein